MTAPTTRRQPASSVPPSGKPAQAQAQRQAYGRRKTRAKAKSEALRQQETAQVQALPVLRPHAAGIDVGSRSHWVCVGFSTEADAGLIQEFPAHTAGLHAMVGFLREHQVVLAQPELESGLRGVGWSGVMFADHVVGDAGVVSRGRCRVA